MSSFMSYVALAFAIVLEVAGTTFLGKSEHFTRLTPSLMCGALYACSFYLLAQALRTLPLGIAYASWGVGYYSDNHYRRGGFQAETRCGSNRGYCADCCRRGGD